MADSGSLVRLPEGAPRGEASRPSFLAFTETWVRLRRTRPLFDIVNRRSGCGGDRSGNAGLSSLGDID